MNQRTILKGSQITRNIPYRDPDAIFSLVGADGKNTYLPVGESILSGHLLLLGGSGTGKSNLLYHMLRNLRVNLSDNDVMIVFDPTGEYAANFRQLGDLLLEGASADAPWNLFCELMDDSTVVEDASAICDTLFAPRIREAADPFCMTAARDLFLALVVYLRRQPDESLRNNLALRELIDGFDTESMLSILDSQPELRLMRGYIADMESKRTLMIVSALQHAARELLQGGFGMEGATGMRQLVRQKGGRVIFLRYDASRAGAGASYAALLGLCLREALSRKQDEGCVYLLLDQPGLLPPIPLLAEGLLLGRAKGIRVLMSAITTRQLLDAYPAGAAMLAAFGTTAAFRLHDRESRAYVKRLYGRHRVVETYASSTPSRGTAEQVMDQFVIEDEDLTALPTGECIIATQHYPPFSFRVKPWEL